MPTENTIHLILDPARPGDASVGPATRVLETLRIPDGVSYLRTGGLAKDLVSRSAGHGLVLEPLEAEGAYPRLLLLAPSDVSPPIVNGSVAERVCLLRIGDQLLLDDGRLLYVTCFTTPRVGPPSEEQSRKLCPVCRTPLKNESRAFTCACGTVMHFDDPDRTPENQRLECVLLLKECPSCHRSIDLEGGFCFVPDLG